MWNVRQVRGGGKTQRAADIVIAKFVCGMAADTAVRAELDALHGFFVVPFHVRKAFDSSTTSGSQDEI